MTLIKYIAESYASNDFKTFRLSDFQTFFCVFCVSADNTLNVTFNRFSFVFFLYFVPFVFLRIRIVGWDIIPPLVVGSIRCYPTRIIRLIRLICCESL